MKARFLTAIASAAVALTMPVTLGAQSNSGNNLNNPSSSYVEARRFAHHNTVTATERGYMIGKPDAKAQLIEFVSYTCGHCADFTRIGEGALNRLAVSSGKMSLEIRPVIRNAVDLTVSMLVQCGGVEDFKARHRMFMGRQSTWLEKARNAPRAQQAIWARGNREARLNAANALDFDDMLAARGASRVDITACLSDNQAALALVRNGNADREEYGVPGTPSFAMDGELLEGVHSWADLRPVLSERFRRRNSQN